MSFANDIDYATLFQTVLDEQVVQESTTGWMDANAGQVQYNGGKTVKVPKMTMTGLGDYSRSGGYPEGSVNLTYETFTMTQDRATQFLLDQMDVNETNFVANATNVMSEFQRAYVVPEIDAYRISKIATYALTGDYADTNCVFEYTPAKATIIEKLADAVEIGGYDSVILATPDVVKALECAIGANNIQSATFAQAGFDQTVPAFNGRPIIKVDASRMVSAITTANLSSGQGGGWSKAASALDINFIVVPRTAPIGVNKLDEPKIFAPEQVQEYSGWLIDYRRYHDLWIMDNKLKEVFVNFKDAAPSES